MPYYTPDTIPADAEESMRAAFDQTYLQDAAYWVDRCRQDLATFWRSTDGAYSAITEVLETPHGRVFHMVASCGAFRPELLAEGEEAARAIGCVKAITEGRPGWQKHLRDYRVTHITLQKDL